MEAAKKKRKVSRAAFTRALNDYYAASSNVSSQEEEIAMAFRFLQVKAVDLDKHTDELFELTYEVDTISEEDIMKEREESDSYSRKFIRVEVQEKARKDAKPTVVTSSGLSGEVIQQNTTGTLRLPKIEIYKFDGTAQNWLAFWSVFKKIHASTVMCKWDKFQYLMQYMVSGSRAEEIVKNYTPTNANYDKVIESLTQRFGREELQIEIYVRELLQLVLQNAIKSSKYSLASLYDKIESYLRALDSLGVTTEKCGAMLYPLVESSLPEELLRAWQRNLLAQHREETDGAEAVTEDRLSRLIKFIEAKVLGEESISIAMQGFGLNSEVKSSDKSSGHIKKNDHKNVQEKKSIPTAAGLFNVKK